MAVTVGVSRDTEDQPLRKATLEAVGPQDRTRFKWWRSCRGQDGCS